MRDRIIVLMLYLLGMGFFAVLGGLRSAADVLRKWGESSSAIREHAASSS
jgi:hypothetical protein